LRWSRVRPLDIVASLAAASDACGPGTIVRTSTFCRLTLAGGVDCACAGSVASTMPAAITTGARTRIRNIGQA
jgi:hypothetical protein